MFEVVHQKDCSGLIDTFRDTLTFQGLLIHFATPNDCESGQRMTESDCMHAMAELGLYCPYVSQRGFFSFLLTRFQ